jgi:hypothetical protein
MAAPRQVVRVRAAPLPRVQAAVERLRLVRAVRPGQAAALPGAAAEAEVRVVRVGAQARVVPVVPVEPPAVAAAVAVERRPARSGAAKQRRRAQTRRRSRRSWSAA